MATSVVLCMRGMAVCVEVLLLVFGELDVEWLCVCDAFRDVSVDAGDGERGVVVLSEAQKAHPSARRGQRVVHDLGRQSQKGGSNRGNSERAQVWRERLCEEGEGGMAGMGGGRQAFILHAEPAVVGGPECCQVAA